MNTQDMNIQDSWNNSARQRETAATRQKQRLRGQGDFIAGPAPSCSKIPVSCSGSLKWRKHQESHGQTTFAEIASKARTGCTQTCPCPWVCLCLCGLGCGHFCILTLDSGRHLCISQFFKETDTSCLLDSHHRVNGIKIGVLCAFSVFCLFLPIISVLLLKTSVKFFSLGQHCLDYNVP